MKYVIIPLRDYVSEPVEAENREDALVDFASKMNTDMSIYFRAVPEDELENTLERERREAHEEFVIDWMKKVLIEDFDIKDEWKARDLAEWAYDRYCDGNGETEYECIEWAYENHYHDDGYDEDEDEV